MAPLELLEFEELEELLEFEELEELLELEVLEELLELEEPLELDAEFGTVVAIQEVRVELSVISITR
jgi:hypothetical protein